MDSLTFKELTNSILSLFERQSDNAYVYNGVRLLTTNVAESEICENIIEMCVGNIDDFRKWLSPQLDAFFVDFERSYFHTLNERINHRRQYAYEKIVKLKTCKRASFKRKMMEEFNLDLISFLHHGIFLEETKTEINRRNIFLNCIKNYIYRLFLIDNCCYP